MNICWVFVDSVRRYYSNDDRSKLHFMDKFSSNSVYFKNMMTCAPSTIMSLTAMNTGLSSSSFADNYHDLGIDPSIPTLSSILRSNGWKNTALIMHPEVREKLSIVDILPRDEWPKGYLHRDWWSNSMIHDLLSSLLAKSEYHASEVPRFFFIDYNCRLDPNINSIVSSTFDLFYSAGYNHTNTIFILCSDHGYPDPSKNITPSYLKSVGLSHDVFMSDDNVMIPFYLSYPGCPFGTTIDTLVSSRSVFSTILNLVGLSSYTYAPTLVDAPTSLESPFPTYPRCDGRFLAQVGGISCVRSSHLKVVFDHDNYAYTLYSLDNTQSLNTIELPVDTSCLHSDSLQVYTDLKHEIERSLSTDVKFLSKRILSRILSIISDPTRFSSICIHSRMSPLYTLSLYHVLSKFTTVYLYLPSLPQSFDKWNDTHFDSRPLLLHYKNSSPPLTLYVGYTSSSLFQFLSRKCLVLDPNLRIVYPFYRVLATLRSIYNARKFYYKEPFLLFHVISCRLRGRIFTFWPTSQKA